ncbi:MAG: hypothetical protein AMXMBFR4_05830 [Candidatus Hydrogenedentota bacterium]
MERLDSPRFGEYDSWNPIMGVELTIEAVRSLLPRRPADGHKGTFGHVLIVAGSRGFSGAAKLAAESAGRSGAGLVTVAVPQGIAVAVAASLFESMWTVLPTTRGDSLSLVALPLLMTAAEGKQAVVLGPGLSTHDETRRLVLEFVPQCPRPLLIDADGLNNLSGDPGVLARCTAPVVLTPHPGEMARLTGGAVSDIQRDRQGAATRFAKRHRCVVVLKGHRTVIADAQGACSVNPTGNSGLATGGSGDVLSGLIGGLLAQGMGPYDAACLGVYLHGLAGDIAAREKTGRGMIARDVIEAIPNAWRALETEG